MHAAPGGVLCAAQPAPDVAVSQVLHEPRSDRGPLLLRQAVDPVLPDVPRPFAAEAAELLDDAFTFAEKLLHNSHEFVGKLIDATDTSKAPAPSAPKATPAPVTKASAK